MTVSRGLPEEKRSLSMALNLQEKRQISGPARWPKPAQTLDKNCVKRPMTLCWSWPSPVTKLSFSRWVILNQFKQNPLTNTDTGLLQTIDLNRWWQQDWLSFAFCYKYANILNMNIIFDQIVIRKYSSCISAVTDRLNLHLHRIWCFFLKKESIILILIIQ